MFRTFLSRLTLTERVTFVRELWAAAAWGLYSGLALSLLSIIGRRIGVSTGGLALMLSMPFAGAVGSFFTGSLAARRRKMPFVFWPNLAASLVLMLAAFARRPAFYVAVVSAWYIFNGLSGPAYAAIVRANYGEANRGRLLGYLRIVITSLVAVFSFVAGQVLDLHPDAYRVLLPVGALFGTANAFLFRRIRVRAEAARGLPGGGMRPGSMLSRVLRDRSFMLFEVLVSFASMPDKLGIPLEPILLVDEIGIGYRDAGLVLGTLTSVVNMLAFWLIGRLAKKGRALTMFPALFALLAIRWAVLAMATRVPHLVPASVCSGLMNPGFELVTMFVLMEFAPGPELPSYIGVHNAMWGIRGLIGPALGTLVVETGLLGLRPALWTIAVITMVGAVALQVFDRARKRRLRSTPPAVD